MDGGNLELLIQFVIRQRRFIRSLETSFNTDELEEGRRALKDALRNARKERAKMGSKAFRDELGTKVGRTRLADTMVRGNRLLSRKHATLMLENFELFNNVLLGNGAVPQAKPKPPEVGAELCTAVDRYYSPVARYYK